MRDYRGGGRASARETATRVAAGAIARKVLTELYGKVTIRGALVQMGTKEIDRATGTGRKWRTIPSSAPTPRPCRRGRNIWKAIRKKGSSVGAMIEVVAEGIPAGLGAPIYAKLDSELAAALMSINAVKGVEIGDGFAAARLIRRGECRRDAQGQ